MSADHDHRDHGAACCHCADCMAQEAAAENRYVIPNGPTIPDPPKIPTGPAIPSPPTTTSPTTPSGTGTGTGSDGYTGPRYHTLLRGDDWNGAEVGTPVLVPYSFATRNLSHYAVGSVSGQPGFDLTAGEPLDGIQRASIREALNLWEQVSGLVFVEVPDPADLSFKGIRFSMENLDWLNLPGVVGFSMPNAQPYGFNIQFNQRHYADNPLAKGTDPFVTALHEIGHAVGLKHPFHGSPNLSAAEDNTGNTVMSYTDGGNYSHLGWIDVAAVQHIYGTQEAKAAAAVHWAHGPNGSLITIGNDAGNAITGLVIRDIVYGNGGDDRIETLGGGDEIAPGAGNDAVFGGEGVDTLVTGFLRDQATLQIGSGKGTVALPDGTDSFYDVEVIRFTDGEVAVGAASAAGQVYRLYGAVLGRAPDAIGLGHWTAALESGAAGLSEVAAGLAASAEFAARYGAPGNAGFVSLLYANVLGRVPDLAGLNSWTDAMGTGSGRVDVLLGFSESAEYRQKTAEVFAQGLWVPDPDAVDALRAYVAVLDRLPDAGGLASWTAAREAGLGRFELIDAFVASAEFQGRFGGLSNRDFVGQLYRTALDREADPDGLAAWTRVLDAGVDSRTGVAFGFANSTEMAVKLAPLVEDGILFA